RVAHGVRGIRLAAGEVEGDGEGEGGEDAVVTGGAKVVSLIVVDGDGDILTASERGYGKRTPVEEYPRKGRGTQGVIAIQCSDRNGALVAAVQLDDAHELMLVSNQGTLVRTRAAEIARVGRNTQGVTLIRLPDTEALTSVVGLAQLGGEDEAETDEAAGSDTPAADAADAADAAAADTAAPDVEPAAE
ncbi:MAG TPA: DNA gyrase C-terminal beta-propeller domain-containing protein, partial [Tahibacter sp.]|nr:DNA gyrase C-terminal beta-propeller domain-containing protein [Tahibacter sp.]